MTIKEGCKNRFLVAFGVFFATTLFCGFSRGAFSQNEPCKGIPTGKGLVNGVNSEGSGVCAFLGVPYAAPPIGELRFALPVEHEPWPEPLEANKVSSQCPQAQTPMTETDIPMNEDCLYLNIWRPSSAGAGEVKKPVMVFIHGGGFIVGSGGSASYNGTNLAGMGDVVVVTVNYRLGVFGFLAHPAFADKNGRTGNWGIYDQLAALKWVKENISNFGGDPDNVTLFGHSAGGMSVGLHLASPLSAGLFKNAILHSGPPILLSVNLEKGKEAALEIAVKLGCGDPAAAAHCLRSLSADRIRDDVPLGIFVMDAVNDEKKYFMVPVVDGEIIPYAPFKIFRDGKFNTGVTVMLGTTKDEAAYFTMKKTLKQEKDFKGNLDMDIENVKEALGVDLAAPPGEFEAMYPVGNYPSVEKAYQDFICDVGFTCPTELLGEMIAKHQPNLYRFYHTKDPVRIFNWGAFHGSELPYVFGNFAMMGQKFKSKDNQKLARSVIALWSSFARTGVPRADDVPDWPKYDARTRSYMTLGDKIEVGSNLKKEKCEVMMRLFTANSEK